MELHYVTCLDEITDSMLKGFFLSWQSPPPPQRILRMLRGSDHVVLALSADRSQIVGLINAITDGCNFAFIPLLEVLPEFRSQGIGRQLVRRMVFDQLRDYPCIDLTCDAELQPFYEKCGMQNSCGMIVRDYSRMPPRH